jgi:hypothetical protein
MHDRDETLRDILLYTIGGAILSAVEGVAAPPRQPRSPLVPPAPVIGMIWSGLFAALGAARGRLSDHPREQRGIDALWLLCATYPLYTGGMRWRGAAYLGNAAVGTAAAAVAARASTKDPGAARLVSLIVPWVAWATLGLLTER